MLGLGTWSWCRRLEVEDRPGREWEEAERKAHRGAAKKDLVPHSERLNGVWGRVCDTCRREEREIGIPEEEANWVPAELASGWAMR